MQTLIVGEKQKHICVPYGFQLIDSDSMLRFDLFNYQSHQYCHYNLIRGEVAVLNEGKLCFEKVYDKNLICDDNGSFVIPLAKAGFSVVALKKERVDNTANSIIPFLDEDTTWTYLNGKLERKK